MYLSIDGTRASRRRPEHDTLGTAYAGLVFPAHTLDTSTCGHTAPRRTLWVHRDTRHTTPHLLGVGAKSTCAAAKRRRQQTHDRLSLPPPLVGSSAVRPLAVEPPCEPSAAAR